MTMAASEIRTFSHNNIEQNKSGNIYPRQGETACLKMCKVLAMQVECQC